MPETASTQGSQFKGWLLRISLAAATSLAGAGVAQAQHLILGSGTGHVVNAEVNGMPLRLKVRLDHELAVNLNPGAAGRARLIDSGKSLMDIGPISLQGRSADTEVMISGRKVEASVRWYDTDAATEADGTISAALLPFQSVTLETAIPVSRSRIIFFKTRRDDNHGIYVPIRGGRRTVAVRFAPDQPSTVALAAAGAVIGREYGGRLGEARTMVDVAFGISRPARQLWLERHLAIGAFTLRALLVRTADFRGGNKLPQTVYSKGEDAIVVTGAVQGQKSVYRMTIGSDVLVGCWAATYARAAKSLVFRCAP